MKFSINQKDLQESLGFCQNVIERRSTLPILSNVLIEAKSENLVITATDLDMIFVHKISNVEIEQEGKTTTNSTIMYDIVRKFSTGKKINVESLSESKLQLESEKSIFKLNCIDAQEFPITEQNINGSEVLINSQNFLKLLNKCKFSISSDETRHYLSGIFFHITENNEKNFLTAVSTDSHRMSISKMKLANKINFDPIILPRKTIHHLCSLLENFNGDIKLSNSKNKIKFILNNSTLTSKVIDGKFPNYIQVIPKNNKKRLQADLGLFQNSVDRVASVSADKKDGVRFNISKDKLDLSVNNANNGDGKETLTVKFEHDLDISFNSKYLIEVAHQLEGENIEIYFNDTSSPALIKDPSDYDSIFIIMPMKA
tara:strand:+ start:10291 stop:11403 length:1113 start_codon:yes stop_codon:yes gene_type:complete